MQHPLLASAPPVRQPFARLLLLLPVLLLFPAASVGGGPGERTGADGPALSAAVGVPGVAVTPDAGTATTPAGSTGTYTFGVRNTGTEAATFRLTAECRNADTGQRLTTGCGAPASVGPVSPGSTAAVPVSFPAAAGTPLTVSLSAAHGSVAGVQDAGWVDVAVTGGGGGWSAPQVRVVDLNSGGQIDRAQCVTVSAGAGAAYECGDLRLAHALPGVTTMGRARAPVLLYNSQHAHPMPTVYADVTLPAGVSAPLEVRAVLTVTGGGTYTRTWPGGDWAPGTTRRIAVQWDGLNTSTGVYAYTLQVTNVYGTAQHAASAISGEIAVVNRSGSSFGAGWWLAGLEQLQYRASDGSFLWIGGDGSTRRYLWAAPGVWRSSGVGRPETLRASGSSAGSYYYRELPGGAQVWFDPSLRHAWTVSALGRYTWFRYSHVGLRRASPA